MFIKNPNLPQSMVKAVLIDYRAEQTEKDLKKLGIKVFKTPKLNVAYQAVLGHPDMLFHQLNFQKAVVAPEAYDYFCKIFPKENIIMGKAQIKNTYPYDIAYNVARINNIAFHKEKYTEEKISEYYNKNGVKLIDVKQGYSKCSICIVSEAAIITADKKIAEIALKNDIDSLLIHEGSVKLKHLPYGFIGGASGLISKEILAFNGDISLHPDYNKIKSFCKNHNVDVYSLNNCELEDIGSIIPIY